MFASFWCFVNLGLWFSCFWGKGFAPRGGLLPWEFCVCSWGVCFLGSFLWACVCINGLFTPFRTYRRKRMPMNNLAIAGNFFLFIEVLERFQVVYGTFWIELFLACHRTCGIFLIIAGIRVGSGGFHL